MATRNVLVLLLLAASAASAADSPLTAEEAQKQVNAKLTEGKPQEAEAIAHRLLAQEEAANRPESPEMQRALDLMLDVFAFGSDRASPDIDNVGRRALALREKLQGPDSIATAHTLRLWAVAMVRRADYSGARAQITRALAIFEKKEADGTLTDRADLSQYRRTLGDMGGILASLMDWNGARRVVLKSISLNEKIGRKPAATGVDYLNLGRVEHYAGDHKTALLRFETSRAILTKAMKPNDPIMVELEAQEARCQFETGDHDLGLANMEKALHDEEAIYGPDHPAIAESIDNLAELYRLQKRFAEAKVLLDRGLAICRKAYTPLHPFIAESEAHLAQVLMESGDPAGALTHALEAERIGREHLSLSVATLPEREATLFAVKRLSALPIALSVALEDTKAHKTADIERAYDALLRSRAIVFDELASRHGITAAASEDVTAIGKLSDGLQAARERLARLAIAGGEDPAVRDEELLRAVQDRDAIEAKLASASVQYRRRVAGRSAGLAEVAAHMPDDAALISYTAFQRTIPGSSEEPREYAAFVSVRGVPLVAVPLGSATEIDAAVDEVRSKLAMEASAPGVATKRNEVAYRVAAENLRRLVWDPVDRSVSGAKRIFIVPDGALYTINFAALPEAGSDTRYLIERGATFHYLSAERDVVTAAALESPGSGLLAVGNPSFDRPELARGMPAVRKLDAVAGNRPAAPVFRGARSTCSGLQNMQFAALPSSLVEVEDISRIWKAGKTGGDVVELTGELAGPARFKQMAPGRRTIHLAVHGFAAGTDCIDPVRNENPLLLTGLAMAGANQRGPGDSGEDGILTAEEIAAMDLRGVEWAVLSACDTGLGKASGSEGVFGLRRAFQLAGAHTVIMSLWPVEDQVTTRWMRSLYEGRLHQHLDTAGAVRMASLEMLKRRRLAGQGTHPFYWAPFLAVGDWR
ncbi:MAG TPA: CHAT domain-containing tetratricopeptide repeat protein [Bryobacteraceae bacterium]|jgi:CHAT domain-containing protein